MADIERVFGIEALSEEQKEQMLQESQKKPLVVLPLSRALLLPGQLIPVDLISNHAKAFWEEVQNVFSNKFPIPIVILPTKRPVKQLRKKSDLYNIGFLSAILQKHTREDGTPSLWLEIIERVKVQTIESKPRKKVFYATITPFPILPIDDKQHGVFLKKIKTMLLHYIRIHPNLDKRAASEFVDRMQRLEYLIFGAYHFLEATPEEEYQILQLPSLQSIVDHFINFLTTRIKMIELRSEILSKVQEDMDKQQRDFILRQQLKIIQSELGEGDEISELKKKAAKKRWPKHAKEAFERELEHLKRIHPASPEYGVTMNYIEWLLALPWQHYTKDTFDIHRARKILEEDHYGLEKVKERILEYLAVLQFKKDLKAPILCFVGPPGVGKTSLGRSIARALNRKFVRISLGGVRDEAEIRGHRKTYIGAMPGRILQGLRKAGSSNPVFLLDEIDKIGSDWRGDPAAALLEVLDPEQNHSFTDHFLGIEYDLSTVLFIATANTLHTLHPALKDRLEIIEINGYTRKEKLAIAQGYLLPKVRKEHGLKKQQFQVSEKALLDLIDFYTRESGVRQLLQRLNSLARKAVKKLLENPELKQVSVSKKNLRSFLGIPRYTLETYEQIKTPGVAIGLAWTPYGGDALFIEVALSKGKGRLHLTGSLGDVMKESANIAYAYLKSHADRYGIDPWVFEQIDVYIHIPAGAVPKDGPSAGITILTALTSAFTKQIIRPSLAMTGELTLRGKLLAVGGIKEKLLAAARMGIQTVLLPKANAKDVEEIHLKDLEQIRIRYVEYADEALNLALDLTKTTRQSQQWLIEQLGLQQGVEKA